MEATTHDQKKTSAGINPNALRAMLDAPSVVTQLERFTILRESPVRDKLISFVSDPRNASLDISRRLVVGEWLAGGAQADVLEGQLLTDDVTEASVEEVSQDEERPGERLQRVPTTSRKVAIKVPRYYTYLKADGKGAKSLLQELQVWREVDHPNVLRLRGFVFANALPAFVSDWMDRGTLMKYRNANPQLDAKSMALQIATGLEYLHSRGIVHADLKSDNILVSDDGRPILADFGVSRFISADGEPVEASYEGSVRWMAFELIETLMKDSGVPNQTKESDVWAFGMVLYELLSARLPYDNVDEAQVMSEIISDLTPLRPMTSNHESFDDLWYLCQKCWNINPSLRRNVSELLTELQTPALLDPLDPSKAPIESKEEGDDWLVVYNPELSRTLDVRLMATLKYTSEVSCVCFSPDGKYIASGCDKIAYIHETETGEEICGFEVRDTHSQMNSRVWSVRFSPDGKYLATGGLDKRIRIWSIEERRIHKVFEGHTHWIYTLCFSRDGRFIVSGSADETARIWDMESGNVRVLSAAERYGPYADIRSVAVSPNMKLVAGGCSDNVTRVWEVSTGNLVEVLKGHTDRVRSIVFTPDGDGLVSGSWDRTMKNWDLTRLVRRYDRDMCLNTLPHADSHPPSPVPSHVLLSERSDRSGTTISNDASSSPGYSQSESECIRDFSRHKNYVTSVAVSPDGKWVVSGSVDADVRIWNRFTAEPLTLLKGHAQPVRSIGLNPNGDILATGGSDRTLRLWKLKNV